MTKPAARFALLCTAVGLGASIGAAYVHYRLLFDPRYVSFCDVSSTVSCTQVYLSRYSLFEGIPIALFGAIWFAVAGLLAVAGLAAPATVRESVPGYLFVLSTAALAIVLYLGYVSFVLLKTVCVLCLITYAAVIGLFLVSGAATSFPMTTLPRRAMRDLRVLLSSPLAIALAVLFFAGAASTLAFFPREGSVPVEAVTATQDQRSEFIRWFASQPRVPLIIPNDGAKVLVVKFNDFQCPPCRQTYLNYKSIFAKYDAEQPGAVRIVYKDYPLDATCNQYVPANGPHPSACVAAVAVRLASFHNRGEAMGEWLFANQPTLNPPVVRQAARDVGQVDNFDARYQSTLELVKGDIALGHQLGVKSTPTFFVNGVKMEGGFPPQYFEQAIQYELEHASK